MAAVVVVVVVVMVVIARSWERPETKKREGGRVEVSLLGVEEEGGKDYG